MFFPSLLSFMVFAAICIFLPQILSILALTGGMLHKRTAVVKNKTRHLNVEVERMG